MFDVRQCLLHPAHFLPKEVKKSKGSRRVEKFFLPIANSQEVQ
jgi:hypothetical protein